MRQRKQSWPSVSDHGKDASVGRKPFIERTIASHPPRRNRTHPCNDVEDLIDVALQRTAQYRLMMSYAIAQLANAVEPRLDMRTLNRTVREDFD